MLVQQQDTEHHRGERLNRVKQRTSARLCTGETVIPQRMRNGRAENRHIKQHKDILRVQEVHLRVGDDLAEHQRQRTDSSNINTAGRDGQRVILLRERAHEHAQRAPRQHRTERKRYAEDMTAAGVSPDDADRTGNCADNADDLLHRHALMQQHRKETDSDRVHAVNERCQRCARQLGAVLLQTDRQHIAAQFVSSSFVHSELIAALFQRVEHRTI